EVSAIRRLCEPVRASESTTDSGALSPCAYGCQPGILPSTTGSSKPGLTIAGCRITPPSAAVRGVAGRGVAAAVGSHAAPAAMAAVPAAATRAVRREIVLGIVDSSRRARGGNLQDTMSRNVPFVNGSPEPD